MDDAFFTVPSLVSTELLPLFWNSLSFHDMIYICPDALFPFFLSDDWIPPEERKKKLIE